MRIKVKDTCWFPGCQHAVMVLLHWDEGFWTALCEEHAVGIEHWVDPPDFIGVLVA